MDEKIEIIHAYMSSINQSLEHIYDGIGFLYEKMEGMQQQLQKLGETNEIY